MVGHSTRVRELEVNRSFDAGQLRFYSEDPECYTLMEANYVVIESKGSVPCTARFDRRKGQIVCDCRQARRQGRCDHQRALAAGLWGHLAALPPGQPLVTCTQDWCEFRPSLVPSFSPDSHPQVPSADPVGG